MPPAIRTLAEVLDLYAREYLPSKAPATQYQHRRLYATLLETFGPLPLSELTPERLRAWRDALLVSHTPGTVRRYMAVLRAPITMAVRDLRWLPEHPFTAVRVPSLPPARVRCLSVEERTRLLAVCQASSQPALYPLVVLALGTGARRNEVRLLRWEQVDLTRAVLRLEQTKNREKRVLPLVGLAQASLETWAQHRHPPRCSWVFPREDGRQPIDITYAWMQARAKAGLRDFHFHDLRHTFASYAAMSGASLFDLAHVLGHKHLEQTRRYAHLSDSHTRGVVERMHAQWLQDG